MDARGPLRGARVLQACGTCARLLDVAGLAVGSAVRCPCGVLANVACPEPRVARAMTCRRCGGPFRAGAECCPWCDAGIALEDRHLAGVCGRCCARLGADVRFCPGCGTPVREQTTSALRADADCPRCRAALRLRHVDACEFVECSSCGGLWLTPATFEHLCRSAEDSGTLRRALTDGPPPVRPVQDTHVRYLPCLTCGDMMVRRNFGGGSGVLIDVCKHHGLWFDADELSKALDYAQGGGLERARERERKRLAQERERTTANLPPLGPIEPDPWERDFGLDLGDVVSALGKLARHLMRR